MPLNLRAFLTIVVGLSGCAGPRAVDRPELPIPLPGYESARAPAPAVVLPANGREDELVLEAGHFHPSLGVALREYLDAQLGPQHRGLPLVLRHVSIKVKSMAPPSDRAAGVVAASNSVAPIGPPGAGLAGALIAAAIIEGAHAHKVVPMVLVNIEGDYGGRPFAGFAFADYAADRQASIAGAVREAFERARDSVREGLGRGTP